MKFTATVFLLIVSCSIYSQSAEEIWNAVKVRYQSIENYVDEGEYTTFLYGEFPSHKNHFYALEIDSNQNVFHSFVEIKLGLAPSYQFRKSAGQEEGEFMRDFPKLTETFPLTLPHASFSLYGVGGGILQVTASLMFPELFDTTGMKSPIQRKDTLIRLHDTLINNEEVYLIEHLVNIYQTQEMIDNQERMMDSILNKQAVSEERKDMARQSRKKNEPGYRKTSQRYYIRKSDSLIVRRERLHYADDSTVNSRSIQTMNPRVDVENFEDHLKK